MTDKKEYMRQLKLLLDVVLEAIGETRTSLCPKFKVSRQRVGHWCKCGVPGKWCHRFSTELHDIVPIEILRPDIYLSEKEKKLLDFKVNEAIVLTKVENWKNEQRDTRDEQKT